MSAGYPASGIPRLHLLRERAPAAAVFPFSERHLQCVWFDPSLRPGTLRSSSGEDVTIDDPGRWNLEAGPDFLDVVLRVGPDRRRIVGDVEVHIHPADWKTHHHSADPRYSRVVAHVSFIPSGPGDAGLPPGAIQISLRDNLGETPGFAFENIDTTAYPFATIAGVRPCTLILAGWRPGDRAALLESAGHERLRVKAHRMAALIEERGEEQALYEEIMASLGYKHNRAPFRLLAATVTCSFLREESHRNAVSAYSLLMGVAGLLPARTSARWDPETRSFVRALWDNWWKQQAAWDSRCLPAKTWRLAGIRPQNHPARRLSAAAVIFTQKTSLTERLKSVSTSDPEKAFKKMTDFFSQASMDYWKRRLGFAGKPQKADASLIGAGRIAAILSNVVVPFLAATGTDTSPLLEHLPAEEDNSLVRQTAFSLFGRDHNPSLYHKGIRQQGLLQIFHDYCLNNRSACMECGLASALRQ